MKWLFLVMLVAAIVVPGKPQHAAPNKDHPTDESSPNAGTAANNHDHATGTQDADSNSPHWYLALKRPEWWLVILGFGTLLFLIYQTNIAKQAAEAALLNAQAIIDAERAWILIERGQSKDKVETPIISYDDRSAPDLQRASSCIFWMKNYGKTPAKIVGYRAELQIGDSQDSQDRPPTPPLCLEMTAM